MGVMDNKVLIFVNFDFGQCWRGIIYHIVFFFMWFFALHISSNQLVDCRVTE